MIDAMQKSTTFFMATLMLFLARTRPVSRQVNPACISKTRAVQVNIQVNGWNEELVGMNDSQRWVSTGKTGTLLATFGG